MSASSSSTQIPLLSDVLTGRGLEVEYGTTDASSLIIRSTVRSRAAVEHAEDERAVEQSLDPSDANVSADNTTVGLIEIQPLPISLEARGLEDDWTGHSNQAVRKKLQNRLNQRASRRRRGLIASPDPASALPDVQAERATELTLNISRFSGVNPQYRGVGLTQRNVDHVPFSTAQYWAPKNPPPHMEVSVAGGTSQECMVRPYLSSIVHASNFARWIIAKKREEQGFNFEAFIHPISADHLLTLTLFNLVRGLTTNFISLGVDPLRMHNDLMSPFTSAEFSSEASNQVLRLPPTLRPTPLQRTVPHHPEVDVLPFPRLRDNAILAAGSYNQVELCMSVLGLDSRTASGGDGDRMTEMTSTGLLVWGESWNPASWEVSEEFAKRWQWLLRGCKDLLDSTNHWRRQRGEPPLKLEL